MSSEPFQSQISNYIIVPKTASVTNNLFACVAQYKHTGSYYYLFKPNLDSENKPSVYCPPFGRLNYSFNDEFKILVARLLFSTEPKTEANLIKYCSFFGISREVLTFDSVCLPAVETEDEAILRGIINGITHPYI